MLDRQVELVEDGERMIERGTMCGEPFERELMEWQKIDRRLRSYHAKRSALDAAEAFDLVRAEELKLHISFGCATFLEYMERHLGHTPHVARERRRVARALVELPQTTLALSTGALSYSHVRELTRVAMAETEDAWLAAIKDRNATEVQALVSGHARGDLPDDPRRQDLRKRTVSLELPPDVFALWRETRKLLADERSGAGCGRVDNTGRDTADGDHDITDADLMEALCRRFLDPGTGETKPAHQIAYTQCGDCKRATQNGAGRELDVAAYVMERAACDADLLGSLEEAVPARVRTEIPARTRKHVFARDRHRCAVPGCRASRNLEVHHIVAIVCGGTHALSNLILLCGGHHAALHAGRLRISGQAPYELSIRWTIDDYRAPETDETADEIARMLRPRSRPADTRHWMERRFGATSEPAPVSDDT